MFDREPRESLEKLGFVRVGASFYMQGPFAVEYTSKKAPFLMVDYEDFVNWPEVNVLKKRNVHGGFGLGVPTGKGTYMEIGPWGGGLHSTIIPLDMQSSNLSMEAQLTNAGFIPDKNEQRLYRRVIKEEDMPKIEIIAVVADGRLRRIYKPIDERITEVAGKKFEIVGYKNGSNDRGENISLITLRNKEMQFDVSQEIDGRIVEGSQKVLRWITEMELGINELQVVKEKSGFKIGGVNSTELIRGLKTLVGQPIEKLEGRLRPNHDSSTGFLGSGESFLEVLATDNDFVLSQGLNHQDLARPLIYAREHYLRHRGQEFTYEGKKFKVSATAWRGMQNSPFDDGTLTNIDMEVENVDTRAKLSCSGLVPDMIQRYGFYEGEKTRYRLAPSRIIEVFDFLKK